MGKYKKINLIIHFRSYRNGTAQKNCANHAQKPNCLHFILFLIGRKIWLTFKFQTSEQTIDDSDGTMPLFYTDLRRYFAVNIRF